MPLKDVMSETVSMVFLMMTIVPAAQRLLLGFALSSGSQANDVVLVGSLPGWACMLVGIAAHDFFEAPYAVSSMFASGLIALFFGPMIVTLIRLSRAKRAKQDSVQRPKS